MKKKSTTPVKNLAAEFGRLGGRAAARKLGKAHMKAIGQKGAQARWGSKRKSAIKK